MALADQALLATDATFVSRVKAALIATCIAITNEATSTALHYRRAPYATGILNSPDAFKNLFAGSVATDAICAGDATQANTVTLTTGNLAAQAALVTDAHINNAISGQFNSFFVQV